MAGTRRTSGSPCVHKEGTKGQARCAGPGQEEGSSIADGQRAPPKVRRQGGLAELSTEPVWTQGKVSHGQAVVQIPGLLSRGSFFPESLGSTEF